MSEKSNSLKRCSTLKKEVVINDITWLIIKPALIDCAPSTSAAPELDEDFIKL